MRVLITGATGFIGKVLVRHLLDKGDEVVVLTSNVPRAAIALGSKCRYFQWSDVETFPPLEAFEGVEGVINLMGEPIAQKWTEESKKKIYESRVHGTRNLVEAISKLDKKPSVLVSGSAVGIYGNRGTEEITEESSLADDFLARVCKDWEAEAIKARSQGLRVVTIRTGVVLGKKGGALQQMLTPFKLGVGGPVGGGMQYMSWIHIDDLCNLFNETLKNTSATGPYNGTAPYPATNKDFSKTLGRTLHRPAIFPVPTFVVKTLFGEMSQVILDGQRVLPVRARDFKFRYRFPTLDMALKETAF